MFNIYYLIGIFIFISLIVILVWVGIIMQNQRKDPLRVNRFRIDIDGIASMGMCEISGIEASIEAIEYREGIDPLNVRCLSGLPSYGKLVIKHGLTDSMELFNWFKKGLDGQVESKNIDVYAMDYQGNDKAHWQAVKCWPTKYSAPDFNSKSNELAFETLEIVYESLTRVL